MNETAEKLFFRYKSGDVLNYSNETLLNLADETLNYARALQNHPEKFIQFLLDLPEPVFAFYNRRVGFDIHGACSVEGISFHHIFEDERVIERKNKLSSPSFLYNELFQMLNSSLHITSVRPLPGCSFVVSVLKKSNKHNHLDDLFITIENQEIVFYELNHTFKNRSYLKNKQAFIEDLNEFQERFRMHFLFT